MTSFDPVTLALRAGQPVRS